MNCKTLIQSLCCLAIAVLLAAAAPRIAAGDETEQERRDRLTAMSAEQKQELQRKRARFDELSPSEQQRLRQLHGDLAARPQLQQVMQRYNEWLSTLSSGERAELLDLSIAERVERIKEIMQRQQSQQFRGMVANRLPREDLKTIYDWLESYAENHREELLEAMSPERKERYEEEDPHRRRRLLMFSLPLWRSSSESFEDEAVQQLLAKLSPQAHEAHSAAANPQQQSSLVRDWIRAAMYAKMQLQVDPDDLQRFYVDDLSTEQRQRLEDMPRDQMLSELRRMYLATRYQRGEGRFRPPFGSGRGPPRGGGGFSRPPGQGPPGGPGGRDNRGPRGPDGGRRPGDRDGNGRPDPPDAT